MKYVMVTGPMGGGKSTLLRSLPGPRERFVPPPDVPDMMQENAFALGAVHFYEIDEPTARGAVWRPWLAAADAIVMVVDAHAPDAVEAQRLWARLAEVAPDTLRLLVLNRAPAGDDEPRRDSAPRQDSVPRLSGVPAPLQGAEAVVPVRFGRVLNEERAEAPAGDMQAVLDEVRRLLGLSDGPRKMG